MTHRRLLLLFVFIAVFGAAVAYAQVAAEDYERAEGFLPENSNKLVFKLSVSPNWIGDGPTFWYQADSKDGKQFIFVDPVKKERRPAFDHERMAEALAPVLNEDVDAKKLPFRSISFDDDGKSIFFTIKDNRWKCSLDTYAIEKAKAEESYGDGALSPDKKFLAFTRDNNLFARNTETGEEIPLTQDGTDGYAYAKPIPSARTMVQQGTMDVDDWVMVTWSPDSKKIFTYRIDSRGAEELYLVQAVPPQGVRPKLYSFVYPLPGEINVPHGEPLVINVENGRRFDIAGIRQPLLYYGGVWPNTQWIGDDKLAFFIYERGWSWAKSVTVDINTDEKKTIAHETVDTFIDPYNHDFNFGGETDLFWTSERDGWGHIYRYDAITGELQGQLTSGDWIVLEIVAVDEEKKRVFFTGGGREENRDPYLRHLYRVNYDGSDLTLLTPEAADHGISLTPGLDYFVDTFSTADSVPRSVLRSTDSSEILLELETADISLLQAKNWPFPEPFKVKARDGKTDIYGLMYRPSNFDPNKKYPVIDNIYTGPHGFTTPKNFSRALRGHRQAIAELGFIVITIDGLGTAKRSKEFHDWAYKNLADGGIPDHIAGMQQLAQKYPYMDLDRVGIFGFSAGGYDTVHAMFAHGDFYKVGVSASGNYDHRMDKAWWNEVWMDFPIGKHYIEQSCLEIAHQLKGKLFLAHGELDENVNPYNTIRLVNELIKANKDFDLLIVPNENHYLGDNPYFIRKRWDFFVRHLLGTEPPEGYEIKKLSWQ